MELQIDVKVIKKFDLFYKNIDICVLKNLLYHQCCIRKGVSNSDLFSILTYKIQGLMARICQITGKRPQTGNNVSHANNKTKRRFLPNLHKKRFFFEEENRWITLKVCTSALRTIDKKGLATVLREAKKKGTLAASVIKELKKEVVVAK